MVLLIFQPPKMPFRISKCTFNRTWFPTQYNYVGTMPFVILALIGVDISNTFARDACKILKKMSILLNEISSIWNYWISVKMQSFKYKNA